MGAEIFLARMDLKAINKLILKNKIMSEQRGRINNLTPAVANDLIVIPESSEFIEVARLTTAPPNLDAPDPIAAYYGRKSNGNWELINGLSAVPNGLSQYASFWQTVEDVTGTIAANNGKVLFETASSNNTAGVTTVAGSGDITIGAGAGGIYEISYQVAGAEPNAFAIFIDGVKAAGSVFGSGAGTQQNNGFVLLTLLEGEVISLRSDNAPAAITLQLAGTTDVDQNVASILFKKLN